MSDSVMTMYDVVMRPVLFATYMGNEKIVRFLMDRGAEISVHRNEHGTYMNVMAMAAFSGNPDVMRLILERSYKEFKHKFLAHGTLTTLNVGASMRRRMRRSMAYFSMIEILRWYK